MGLQDDLNDIDWLVKEKHKLEAEIARLRAALVPFARYAEMRDAKPLVGLDDAIHRIHLGSEWEAEITLTDCHRAWEALK